MMSRAGDDGVVGTWDDKDNEGEEEVGSDVKLI